MNNFDCFKNLEASLFGMDFLEEKRVVSTWGKQHPEYFQANKDSCVIYLMFRVRASTTW